MSDKVRRLWQIIELVARQDEHLQGVRRRLFGAMNPEAVNGDWVARTLASAEGIDRIESFGAKFARMQDTVMDKLLPQFLAAVGEKPGTAIDNLNRAERLTLVRNADDWLAMRRLRNRLVHEYIDEPKEMAPALQRVRTFTDELHRTYAAIRDYAASHLESG
ncbi:MAG: hypothetical protein L0H73_08005 [Nitrococcus sp.]|nr:hypothetical protein [Nitrococcus sp.]